MNINNQKMYKIVQGDSYSTVVRLILTVIVVSVLAGFGLWSVAWLMLGLASFVEVVGALRCIYLAILSAPVVTRNIKRT